MGKIGFLFAGQGAQKIGMGKELFDKYECAKNIFNKAEDKISGIEKMCFEGPIEELNQTINTQPCIYTTNMAILEVLTSEGIVPDVIAGFSLGELSALACGGAISMEKGLEIVKTRGTLMQNASNSVKSSLIAVIGMNDEVVEALASDIEDAYPVNYNCPGQVVVAVGDNSVEKFMGLIKSNKGRAMKLPVSGGFHSPYMNGAASEFKVELEKEKFEVNKIPVYSNYSGGYYTENILENLSKQVNNPVKWNTIIKDMILNGVDTFVEIGPGTTLSGFVKKTLDYMVKNDGYVANDIKILNVQDEESLIKTLNVLKGE